MKNCKVEDDIHFHVESENEIAITSYYEEGNMKVAYYPLYENLLEVSEILPISYANKRYINDMPSEIFNV